MKRNKDLSGILDVILGEGGSGSSPKAGKELLFRILGKMPIAEQMSVEMCTLFKGEFLSEFEKLCQEEDPDLVSLAKLEIMLQNQELTADQIARLSKQRFLRRISAKSLLAGAKVLARSSCSGALRLMEGAGGKIDNAGQLSAAVVI